MTCYSGEAVLFQENIILTRHCGDRPHSLEAQLWNTTLDPACKPKILEEVNLGPSQALHLYIVSKPICLKAL